jgi:hypothetical protein
MRAKATSLIIAIFAISIYFVLGFTSSPNAYPSHEARSSSSTSNAPAVLAHQLAMLDHTPPVIEVAAVTQPAQPTPVVVGDYDHRWDAVATCEEGGWGNFGFPAYPNSLGINSTNWYANGGGSDLSPAAQVAVAQRIEGTSYVPDQGYCAAW